jgi:PAT family beta-lactamase induction signal transducer AmpG
MAYGLTTLCVLPAVLGAFWAGEGKFVDRFSEASGMKPGQWLVETVVNPFREFLTRDGALMILLFILVYKVGDAMGQAMLGPMIVDLKFADLDYISASKIWGFAAVLVGSALGGPFVLWLGMGRALLVSVLLMMFSNLMFMALSIAGNDYWMLVAAIVTENITSGIGLTVVAVYLSGLSNIAYTATQFALLSSVAVIGRTFMAGPAGYAAEKLGWTGFWGLTVAAAIPGMILLWMMWRRGYVVQSIRQSGAVDQTKLRKPGGAARIAGFALIVAGVVGVLLANQLELASQIMYASLAALVVGALLAWKGKALAATA